MKICMNCGEEKALDQFNKKETNKDRLQKWCRICQNTKNRQHYQTNKPYYYSRNKRRVTETREWIRELRSTLKCIRCGESDYACLDFHHIDPASKDFAIGSILDKGWRKERIMKEIDKCIVLCSNCHRKHHRDERLNIPL